MKNDDVIRLTMIVSGGNISKMPVAEVLIRRKDGNEEWIELHRNGAIQLHKGDTILRTRCPLPMSVKKSGAGSSGR